MTRLLLTLLCLLALTLSTFAAPPRPVAPGSPATQPGAKLPGITVDPQNRFIDLDATVCTREGEWLELLGCVPRTKEYESVVAIAARPSHVHLALLLLGCEPGSPIKWKQDGEKLIPIPPKGPRIAVTFRYEKDGKTVEVPANQWVRNQKAQQLLSDNIWIFAGSVFDKEGDKEIYRADVSGSLISLVNFGDDLLTRPTTMTDKNDEATWGPVTKEIPPLKSKLTVRLTPLEKKAQ